MKKQAIETRYEYISKDGKVWSDWYVMIHPTEDAEERLKAVKAMSVSTDKITKLKHEYRLKDEETYNEEFIKKKKKVEEHKKDFASIVPMKKPWLKEARKERKKLKEMSNAEKVLYRARKNDEFNK